MGRTSNESKQRFNEAHYVQLKVSVKPEVAAAFKEKCGENGVSMAGVLSQFMAAYSGATANDSLPPIKTKTRPDRRESVKSLIAKVEQIHDAEQAYMDNIPQNLQSSPNFAAAEASVAALADAMDLLHDAY
jgi:hypothetical protein